MPTCSLDESISISSCFYRNIYRFWCSSSLLTVNLAAFAAGAPYRARPWYTSSEGRAGRIPVSTETPLRAWLPDRSERQFSVPSGIRVQFLHELVAPIRHNLSTSPGRSHSTRKKRDRVAQGRLPIFMPLGACKGITIPTKQKRRSRGSRTIDAESPDFMRVQNQ